MKLTISSAYRAILYSVSSLVVFYLLYVAANFSLLRQSATLLDYEAYVSDTLLRASEQDDATQSLSVLLQGGSVQWRGRELELKPLATMLAPSPVDIGAINHAFDSGDKQQIQPVRLRVEQAVSDMVQRKRRVVTYLQPAVAFLSIVFYLLVIYQVVKRSAVTEAREELAKEEADSILSTVTEGLFLMRADFEIGIEQSASLKDMFRSEQDLQGNFFEFIGQYVTPNTLQIAKDYIGLLFGERVKEKLVRDLNPLNQVEINIIRRDGSFESRFLNFSFKRVLNRGALSHLLCSVTDVTREVLLEKQLKQAQEEQEAQIDLLMSVLHIPSEQLGRFFKQADSTLLSVNDQLENQCTIQRTASSYDSVLRQSLMDIASLAHRLKGDAAALGLNKFEFLIHDFEESIVQVQQAKDVVDGKALLPVVSKLRSLFNELDQMRTLVSRFAELSKQSETLAPSAIATEVEAEALADASIGRREMLDDQASDSDTVLPAVTDETDDQPEPQAPSDEALNNAPLEPVDNTGPADNTERNVVETPAVTDKLQNLAQTVAARQSKEVAMTVDMTPIARLDESVVNAVEAISIQLIRNSIVHGIELPDDRVAQGKPSTGRINVTLTQDAASVQLLVVDDGQGIDASVVLNRAKVAGYVPEHISELTKKQVMALLFKPGFSSNEEVDLDAGRGVGLDAVAKLVKQHGGKLALNFVAGQQCRFKIVLPLVQHSPDSQP